MGGLWFWMFVIIIFFLVGIVGLVGLLFLGGFWVLWEGLDVFWIIDFWVVFVLLFVNFLSVLNLICVFCLVFLGEF